jgi:hypothetical protein
MFSLFTFIFEFVDTPMQLPVAFPHRSGEPSFCLGNTVAQASDFIIGHVFQEKRDNVSADHLGHLGGIQIIWPPII